MSIIERAARATFEAVQADGGGFTEPWDAPSMERVRATYRKAVAATIAAIREPSEAMIKAGNGSKPYNLTGYCEGTIHPVVQRAWPAMIDAALEEG